MSPNRWYFVSVLPFLFATPAFADSPEFAIDVSALQELFNKQAAVSRFTIRMEDPVKLGTTFSSRVSKQLSISGTISSASQHITRIVVSTDAENKDESQLRRFVMCLNVLVRSLDPSVKTASPLNKEPGTTPFKTEFETKHLKAVLDGTSNTDIKATVTPIDNNK